MAAGGWKRTDLFSATAGPMAMIRRPVTARPAQDEAGEEAPCRTKSMSTSSTPAGVRRCSRTVYERITGRSSSGIARQSPNQVSSAVDGSAVCSRPAGGRKRERLWS